MINLPPPPNWKPRNKYRYKGVSRRATQDERKLIAEYIRQHGDTKATEEFCISTTLTRSIRKQFGIAARKPGRQKIYGDEDVVKWIEYLKTNTLMQTAANFSCSHDTITRRINEYKNRTNKAVL